MICKRTAARGWGGEIGGPKLPESVLLRTRAEERPAGGIAIGERAALAAIAEAAADRPLGIAQLGQRGGVGGTALHLGGDHRGDLRHTAGAGMHAVNGIVIDAERPDVGDARPADAASSRMTRL